MSTPYFQEIRSIIELLVFRRGTIIHMGIKVKVLLNRKSLVYIEFKFFAGDIMKYTVEKRHQIT